MSFLNFGNYQKEGPGVSKGERKENRFVYFFKLLIRKFWKLIALNVICLAITIPVIVGCYFTLSNFVFNSNPLSEYVKQHEMADEISSLSSKYIEFYKYDDELLEKFCVKINKAVYLIEEVQPEALKVGIDKIDLSKFTDKQISELSEYMNDALEVVGIKVKPADDYSKTGKFILTDTADNQVASYKINGTSIEFTDNMIRTYPIVKVFLCLLPIILLGPVIAAATKITREFVKEEPVFLISDFFDTIKKNWKQSLVMSTVFYLMTGISLNAVIMYYSYVDSGWLYLLAFGVSMLMLYVVISMQFYAYMMLVTLKLNLKQIFKNSLYFTVLGLFKNLFIILILAAGALLLLALLLLMNILFPLAVCYVILMGLSLPMFIISYLTYPLICKFIIEPYYKEHPEETAQGIKMQLRDEDNQGNGGSSEIKDEFYKDNEQDDDIPEYIYHNGKMVHRSILENENVFLDNNGDKN